MKGYYVGAKPKLYCETRDIDGALVDPDTSITCAIYEEDTGKLVSATATETAAKESTGVYYYDSWLITSSHKVGRYLAIFTITDSGHITRDKECSVPFEVLAI